MKKPTFTSLLSMLIAIAGLFLCLNITPAMAQQKQVTHTVKQGETLFSISQQYNVEVSDLRKWNNLKGNELELGQKLIIKKSASQAPPSTSDSGSFLRHRVNHGETLFSIAKQNGVSVDQIKKWNNMTSNDIEVGQVLRIKASEVNKTQTASKTPSNPPKGQSLVSGNKNAAQTYYTVQSGDNLYKIAHDHNMTVSQLKSMNKLNSNVIHVGQRLLVRSVNSTPSVAKNTSGASPQGKFMQYQVKRSDNTSGILKKFQMDKNELVAMNPDININRLSSGDKITVLVPPTTTYKNPYHVNGNMEEMGDVAISKYSDSARGSSTTNGELYNPDQLTAASSSIALGSIIFIENPENGRGVFVRINDRTSGNNLKLSAKAYQVLNFQPGTAPHVKLYKQ